ncbi:DnaJ family domain-containing protein [Rosenbergiella epipactidis]|uniref:DnaJ family domain-containing protein n=1 Tax=Rosenbergiella epipactidis TaxID=1544694 RepID=UPI001F4F1885|nr:DnaJ family domain-containing protein [Rosenbergiella epipactidis]
MLFLDSIVERQLQEAQQQGKFDNLPGAGKPLLLDDDSQVPEDLRMSYRILKMSGFLPEALQLRQEALTLQTLLVNATNAEERSTYHAHLALIRLKISQAGLSTQFLEDDMYGKDVKGKLLGKNEN